MLTIPHAAEPARTMLADSDEWLTPKEAALRIKCSVHWLEILRIRGTGPAFHRNGRRVLYRKSDIDAWILRRVYTSTSDTGKAEA